MRIRPNDGLKLSGFLSLALAVSACLGAADQPSAAVDAATSPSAASNSDSSTASSQLGTFVVKAAGISQEAAFGAMHDSLIKVNVLSQDQINDTPAKSVGQAAQEIPGASIRHDTGEPRFILIRGTDPNLDTLTFHDTILPSYVAGARSVAVDDIPAGLVSNLELFKTNLPSMDAEGIGGQFNMVPQSAFDYPDDLLELNAAGGFVPERGTPTYYANLTVGRNYDLGGGAKLGVLVTGLLDDKKFGIDDLEAGYTNPGSGQLDPRSVNNYSFRWYNYDRFRTGLGANVDLSADHDNKYYLNFMTGGYDEYRTPRLATNYNNLDVIGANGATVNADGSFTVNPALNNAAANGGTDAGGEVTKSRQYALEKDHTMALVLGGSNKMDSLTLDYQGSYSSAYQDTPYNYNYNFNSNPGAITGTINYNTTANNGDSPNFNTFNLNGQNNPNNYSFSGAKNTITNSNIDEYGLQANGKIESEHNDGKGTLQFGARARLGYAYFNQTSYKAKPSTTPLLLSAVQDPADYAYYPPSNMYDLGPSIGGQVANDMNSTYTTLGFHQYDVVGDLGADWSTNEDVYAAYAMYTLELKDLTLEGGARLEVTAINYNWNQAYDTLTGNELTSATPQTGSIDYSNVLPNIGVKYVLSPAADTRLWYSQSIARPTDSEYIPAVGIGSNVPGTDPSVGGTYGNSNLKPILSNNIDYTWEYYPDKGAILGADLFYKGMTNYIKQDYSLFDSSGGAVANVSYSNIPFSEMYGLELQYQQQYTFLPQPLDGLGLRGALVRVWSHGTTTPGKPDTVLPGQADLTWNAGVFYKKAAWTFNVDGNYTGPEVYQIGDLNRSVPNTWYDSYFQIDAKVQYALSKAFKIYVDGNNLNNAPLRYYQDPGPNYPNQTEYYGPSGDLGMTVDF